MEFEWDEAKRLSNVEKHNIDFWQARQLFDGRPTLEVPGNDPDEQRFLRIGMLEDRLVTVVWTQRGDAIRIISVRRTRDGEERAYRAIQRRRTR